MKLTREKVEAMLEATRQRKERTPWQKGWQELERLCLGWLEMEQENARLREGLIEVYKAEAPSAYLEEKP